MGYEWSQIVMEKRYNEVKDDHLGLLPSRISQVLKFKKRISAMDQEAIEEATRT